MNIETFPEWYKRKYEDVEIIESKMDFDNNTEFLYALYSMIHETNAIKEVILILFDEDNENRVCKYTLKNFKKRRNEETKDYKLVELDISKLLKQYGYNKFEYVARLTLFAFGIIHEIHKTEGTKITHYNFKTFEGMI